MSALTHGRNFIAVFLGRLSSRRPEETSIDFRERPLSRDKPPYLPTPPDHSKERFRYYSQKSMDAFSFNFCA